MPVSAFAQRLATVAIGEHQRFSGVPETDRRLRSRIYDTYLAQLKAADPNDPLGWAMSSDISAWAWSATFVSWCLLDAGATNQEFDFSIRHAMYIRKAIADADAGRGVFRARPIDSYAPDIGDVICANRGRGRVTYDEARSRDSYNSHGAIVVDLIERAGKRYAVTVGGNESDSIRRTEVELTRAGTVRQRSVNPYICVIQNMKDAGTVLRDIGRREAAAGAGLSQALRGHGTFVYDAVATIDDYGSAANTAQAMVRAGMTHAWIRIHGRSSLNTAQTTATRALIDAVKAAGVAVAGWGWCQGEDARGEARTALRELASFGLVDYVADIEPGHNNSMWRPEEIETFGGTIRDALQGSFGVSSFALVDWHEPQLMAAILPFVDAVAPQVYWFNFPNRTMVDQFRRPGGTTYGRNDPAAYADLCLDRWRRLSLTDPKPLILTGQAYWGEGGFNRQDAEAKLQVFLNTWAGYGQIAGLNWWHFGGGTGMSHAMLEAIVSAQLDTKPYQP
ncbi:DUF2272 domain-containing protein [Inquilinus sp. NPDC058860]|uniref:DUF2272 domain-containing protein n=1 Tax=Inquilinus sp. NPDC058860 TaxID=3346652 RepID=UPI0036B30F49